MRKHRRRAEISIRRWVLKCDRCFFELRFAFDMCWNSCFVLLSFASLLMKGKCQDNTPPYVWMESREWNIRENETVGFRVTQVHADDAEGEPLTYGLEPSPLYISKYPNRNLPFRIDNETGTVYLNESLMGRAEENLHLYVIVSDGKYNSKNEANVNIIGAKNSFNPSKPKRPPIFTQNINYPNYHHPIIQRPPSPPSNYPDQPVINNPPFFTKQPPYYPSSLGAHGKNKNSNTVLKPVPVPKDDVKNDIDETPKPTTEKTTTTKRPELDVESSNDLLTSETPVKSVQAISSTIVPAVAVFGVFLTVAVIAFVFRKKIYSTKKKDSKDDMRKESSNGNAIVLQDDSGLNLQEWRGPRAFSNRYESWQGESNRTQVGNQLSTTVKNADRWEFPRHRLKFFNILGEGAFGQVWKCEALDLDEKDAGVTVVAVKTLKENANEKEKSDLLSELQVMKMLEPHANVVRLLGCCTDKEPIFLIMEYISKGKLQSYLRNSRAERYYNNMHGHSRSLTSRDLTSFGYQVAKGMEFLSNNGIIHRDLAARNVLITEEHVCKVADFGFARDIIANHIYERKSEGRLPIRWMAPESLYDNIFTVKSDVWSFGVLIWEIVTLGSTPYPGMSAVEVMKKVRDGYRLDKPEHCRRELYNIMYYCWDKDPKERPSFSELLELLEKLLMTETDYIELERFPDHSYYNVMSLSGEKL
ncbi:unnamed protein product [Phyllotreta striolata]|uniref:receptor protein-tyrosine kinase n=1 Tax=Phyllotreta striolata TaxID=444603 RepID=A0A9N9XIM9_PHYSR|nr:unnamed protein product [Phyllotreta striolata]